LALIVEGKLKETSELDGGKFVDERLSRHAE
jgi:hypothetical protein